MNALSSQQRKLLSDIQSQSFKYFDKGRGCWLSPWHYGINQGPIVLMIENHFTDFVWRLMKKCPYIVEGLRRAGFSAGWLD